MDPSSRPFRPASRSDARRRVLLVGIAVATTPPLFSGPRRPSSRIHTIGTKGGAPTHAVFGLAQINTSRQTIERAGSIRYGELTPSN